MALRTGANIRTSTAPSRSEVRNRALDELQQQGTVATPTETLGTIATNNTQQTGGASLAPSQAPQGSGLATSVDASSSPLDALVQSQDPRTAQLLGGSRRAPQQATTSAPQQPQGLSNTISSKVSTSPLAQDVLETSVPVVNEGDSKYPAYRTQDENLSAYDAELQKQRLPGYESDLLGRITDREADSTYNTDFNFDDDFDAPVRHDPDVDRSDVGFLSTTSKLGEAFDRKSQKDPRVETILQKANLKDADGNINQNAVGALMFSIGLEKSLNDVRGNEQSVALAEEIDRARTGGRSDSGLTEADLRAKQRYQVLNTSLDRQQLQTSLFPRFQQIYKGLDESGDSGSGVFSDRSQFDTTMGKEEQALFATAAMDMMESIGLVSSITRRDPETNKDRVGYEPNSNFTNVFQSVEDLIGEYNDKLTVGVSKVPLVDGVPVGHAAAQHAQLTKADPRVKLKSGDPVLEAMDIAGKTPWTISLTNMTGEAVFLPMVLQGPKDPVFGFFTNQYASNFLLDSKTFLKHMPSVVDIEAEYKAEVDQFNKVSGKTDIFETPYISESSKKPYRDILTIQNEYAKLKNAADFGDRQAAIDLNDLMKRVIQPAKNIQRSVANSYAKDIIDGTGHVGDTFYYPQRAQAGTTRIQVGTSTLNYQNSKKARAMVANPTKYVVFGRSEADIKAGKGAKTSSQIKLEAMIARNFEEGGKSLSSLVGIKDPKTGNLIKPSRLSEVRLQSESLQQALLADPNLGKVARFVSSMSKLQEGETKQWATNVQAFVNEKKSDPTIKNSNITPGNFSQSFPKMNLKFDAISEKANLDLLAEYMDMGSLDANTNTWKPNGKSDHGGFVFNSLKTLGDYLIAGDNGGQTIQTDLTTEIDGIASGLTLQGYQFGNGDYLRHGGVLYDGIWTTPEGDIRDMIQKNITDGISGGESVLSTMGFTPEKLKVMEDTYDAINNAGKSKNLHKTGAMTVAYSMEPKAASKNSVGDFQTAVVGTDLQGIIEQQAGKLNLNYDDFINEMINIEAKAISSSLGTSVQMSEAVYQVGLVAAIVNEPYIYRLNNGHEMYISGVRYEDVGSPQTYLDEQGKERVITTKQAVSDPTQRAFDGGKGERAAGSKVGKVASVLPTQGMDAEIAQRTLIELHKELPNYDGGIRRQGTDYAWGGQVFDAFISDLGSYSKTREVANKQFLKVNRDTDQAQFHLDALNRLKKSLRRKVTNADKDFKFEVRPDGEYAGAFEAFRDAGKRVNDILKSEQLGNLGVVSREKLNDYKNFLAVRAKFNLKYGGDYTPAQFEKLVNAYLAVVNPEGVLRKIGDQNRRNRNQIDAQIKAQEADGRPVVQYG